jgi:phosphatidylglycerophosphatase A
MSMHISARGSLATWIATLGGVGRVGRAPGSVASALSLVPAYLIARYLGGSVLFLAIFAAVAIGTWASDVYAREIGSDDPSECVVDELAGQWLACALAPLSLSGYLFAFLAFRLFDIVKPWPVSAAERLGGGAGIMCDDLLAGLFAGLIVAVAAAVGLG